MNNLLLVACSKNKLDVPAPACKLYTGQLFKAAMRYVRYSGRPFLILSAKYGWLYPNEVIAPYDEEIPYHRSYTGEWPNGSGHYIGGQQYFRKAPERFQPLVPHYHNRGTLSWQSHINNMIAGIGCPHGFTDKTKHPCPLCNATR